MIYSGVTVINIENVNSGSCPPLSNFSREMLLQ